MQTKKKVLIGGLSSLAVAAGVAMTGGTSAYFYDLENSRANRIAACSLDLVADKPTVIQTADGSPNGSDATIDVSDNPDPGGPWGAGTPWEDDDTAGGLYQVSIGNMEPGDAFKVTIPVRNDGDCIGELWGDLRGPFNDSEGTNYEPETAWQAAGNDPDVQGADDLERQRIVTQGDNGNISGATVDAYDGGAGDLDNRVLVYYGPDEEFNELNGETFSEFAWRKPVMMDGSFEQADGVKNIVVDLTVPDSGAPGDGNEIMGDSFDFMIDLALAQPDKLNASNTAGGLHAVTPGPAGPPAP